MKEKKNKVSPEQEKKWAAQYAHIVKVTYSSFVMPAPDNSSLAQPSPTQDLPTFATAGAGDRPITA